jgi:erythromycin esterase
VVVFESPYYDCQVANADLPGSSAVRAAQGCLITQLQHAEIKPLFEYLASTRSSSRPLHIAGMDLQVALRSARTRPNYLRAGVNPLVGGLGDRVALVDSALIEASFAGADTLRPWVTRNGASAQMLLDSAAAVATGDLAWVLRTESALLERLRLQGSAEGGASPVRYYELRDEWMARSVLRAADSTGSRRKLIVWLHNDHARYGTWATPSGPARATGQFLRSWDPDEVFSVGFFMGRGTIADNSRRPRSVIEPPADGIETVFRRSGHSAGLLLLRNTRSAAVRRWAQSNLPYVRAGLAVDSLIPGREFDALIYVDAVKPPTFGIR